MPIVCVCFYMILFLIQAQAASTSQQSSAAGEQPKARASGAGTSPPGLANAGAAPVLSTAPTQTPSSPQELNQPAATNFTNLDLLTGDWGGLRKRLKDDGFKLSPTYIGEVFGNPSGGMAQGATYDGLLNVALDLDLERMSGGDVNGLTIHANAYEIHGNGLSQSDVGDFSNTSNIAAYNTLRLQELWLQKWIWDKRLSLKIGNIAVDSEFFQSASGALFINGTFGTFTLLANNVLNAPVYPLASPGVRFQLLPTARYYLTAGVFGMDIQSNPATNNQNGTLFSLTSGSGLLVMSEAGYLLNQTPNDRGLQGSYRLGSFVHTANYSTWGSQAQAALGTGPLQSAGTNYGIYGVMDQQIFQQADEAITFFVRSGGAPSNVNFVDWYAEGGFNFTGFVPGRSSDIAGLAVARSHVSCNFSDSQVARGDAPFTAETVLEATYKVQLAPWWSLQPDFQYIISPSGEAGVPNATVLGLRTTIAF